MRTLAEWNVSDIGLGGMPLSIRGRPAEADAVRVIRAALDAGMTLIDTANVYCIDDGDIGHNERLIAKALEGRSDRVVVATKGGLERPKGAWVTNGHPGHLRQACERSLKALGVERIDVYQLHAPDDQVALTDSVGALARLREEGKIAHVGLSNVTVAEIDQARALVPIVSVQNRCGPLDTSAWEDGVLAHCTALGITFLAYSPVNGSRGKGEVARSPALVAVGARHGVSPFQVALAWLLAQSPIMLPIPGASRTTSATDSAAAMALRLSAADRAELDRVFLGTAA